VQVFSCGISLYNIDWRIDGGGGSLGGKCPVLEL